MAFTDDIDRRTKNVIGDRRISYGTYSFSAVNTGNIDTGLKICEFIQLQDAKGEVSVSTAFNFSVVTTTAFPVSGSAVPVAGSTGASGIWVAYGSDQ